MAVSVYIALTAEGLSSHVSPVKTPRSKQKSRADSSMTRQPHSHAMPSRMPRQRKTGSVGVPRGRSKREKKPASEVSSVTSLL
jgi:hypothetical protein